MSIVAGRASGVKFRGSGDANELASSWVSSAGASISPPVVHSNPEKMSSVNKKVGCTWTLPNAYVKDVEKPNENAAHCVKAHSCEHQGDKLDKLWEGWEFRIGTWNADSRT